MFPPPGAGTGSEDSRTPVPILSGTPGVHEKPTRLEPAEDATTELTSFLAPAEEPDEIGRLGTYRVLEVLGSGGMGVVFKAEDPFLGRLVALKAMLPSLAAGDTARLRFLREARAAASVEHDHIVSIFQIGEDRGVPFIAMPLLQGESLDARVRRLSPDTIPIPEVVRIGRQIAEGLQAVHARDLIHRDIKPANIWLEAPGSRVKILDFGLARTTTGEGQLTQIGAIVGSPAFMAPEQASRQSVDARCDLFSLGCVLYVMCTGELPFAGDDTLATLMALASTIPLAPHERNPEVPEELAELVMHLLAKKPAERPGSAAEVIERLRAIERAA
jgi:serine/threonine protein kinase